MIDFEEERCRKILSGEMKEDKNKKVMSNTVHVRRERERCDGRISSDADKKAEMRQLTSLHLFISFFQLYNTS